MKNLGSKTPCDPQYDYFVFMEHVGPFGFSNTIIIWTMLFRFHFLSIYGKARSGCGPTKFCWLKLQPNVCQRNRHFFWSNGQTSILLGCCTSLFLWLSFDSEQKWCTPNLIARTFHEHFRKPDFVQSRFLLIPHSLPIQSSRFFLIFHHISSYGLNFLPNFLNFPIPA